MVGKVIGGFRYTHRDYALMSFMEAERIFELLQGYQTPTIVKSDAKTGAVISLIWSPDFDTANEPIIRASMNAVTGKFTMYKPPFWIYHHKWQMVGEDYKGFDYEASKARSWHWSKKCKDHSRIGKQDVWFKLLKKWGMKP